MQKHVTGTSASNCTSICALRSRRAS